MKRGDKGPEVEASMGPPISIDGNAFACFETPS